MTKITYEELIRTSPQIQHVLRKVSDGKLPEDYFLSLVDREQLIAIGWTAEEVLEIWMNRNRR